MEVQAVIGGGAAGLVAGKVLREEGHQVRILEQGSNVGGVWVYTDHVDDDPLGRKPPPPSPSCPAPLRNLFSGCTLHLISCGTPQPNLKQHTAKWF
jgi:cation diffusion facilitator CzcD-associated flavoprotein CzcO